MKKNILLLLFFCYFLYAPLLSFAQESGSNKLYLNILPTDTDSLSLAKLVNYPAKCSNKENCEQNLGKVLEKLNNKGYLTASIDRFFVKDSLATAHLFLGKKYTWLQLQTDSIDNRSLSASGFNASSYKNKALNLASFQQLQKRLTENAENNGYPFAKVGLQHFSVDETGNLSAQLYVDKHHFIKIDSLIIHGDVKINRRYLQNYLDIQSGDTYDESSIQKMSSRLRELPFLRETSSANVGFIRKKAKVHLYLKRKKASKFDFLLGLIPRDEGTNTNNNRRSYELTGEGQLNLQNALGAGELIDVRFRSFPGQTQEVGLQFLYPYLPFVPIGIDLKFDLYKKDELYRDVIGYVGFQYLFKGNNYIKAFFKNSNSILLSIDTARLISSKQLPEALDVKNTAYGLAYNWESLDYRFNPRKGIASHIEFSVGNKKVIENTSILALAATIDTDTLPSFEAQYAALNKNSLQYKISYTFDKYWQMGKRSTLKTGVNGAFISDKKATQNELFRIGGSRLLRGFDDESISASWYNVLTLEYRYLLGQNSYVFLFGDAAYRQTQGQGLIAKEEDWPFGFGAGITFETKAGLFGLSYALGSQQNNPVRVRDGKVHFGYVNYF